jgi:hypothetical protein
LAISSLENVVLMFFVNLLILTKENIDTMFSCLLYGVQIIYAAGGNRTPDAMLFLTFSQVTLRVDYIIIPTLSGFRALMQDYCWDSPASLYTCSAN